MTDARSRDDEIRVTGSTDQPTSRVSEPQAPVPAAESTAEMPEAATPPTPSSAVAPPLPPGAMVPPAPLQAGAASPEAASQLVPVDTPSRIRLVLVSGGSVLAVIGSMMSWISGVVVFAGSISFGGFDGDGKFTAALAAALFVLGFVYLAKRTQGWLLFMSIVAGLLAALSLYEIIHVTNKVNDFNSSTKLARLSVGDGLWVVVCSAALAVVGVVLCWRDRRAVPRAG